jgi:t-SNARE complex subunit (syntaxin)
VPGWRSGALILEKAICPRKSRKARKNQKLAVICQRTFLITIQILVFLCFFVPFVIFVDELSF